MALFRHVFMAIAFAGLIAGGPALAQAPSMQPPAASKPAPQLATKPAANKPAKPADGIVSTARKQWDGVSAMTRRQWNNMKGRWSREKAKWATCNDRARARKLSAPMRWTAVVKCMIN